MRASPTIESKGGVSVYWFLHVISLESKRYGNKIEVAALNSFADDLDENPFSSSAVKLAIKNLFPRAEIELAFCDSHHRIQKQLDAFIPVGHSLFEQVFEKVDFEDAVFFEDFEILGILVQCDGNTSLIGVCIL